MLKLPCNGIPNCVVDTFPPEMSLCWRRASSFCKALLKKSTSTVLSASNRFSLLTSLRSLLSREFCADTVPSTSASGGSSRYRQVYSRPRLTPSSCDSLVMFSQASIRATALRRNFCLYRSFHFLSTSQLLSCKPANLSQLTLYANSVYLELYASGVPGTGWNSSKRRPSLATSPVI